MAVLISFTKEHLSIEFLGYEYPNSTGDQYDSNWLRVRISGQKNGESAWTMIEPCLLTFEVEKLCRWLKERAKSGGSGNFRFIEPFLEVSVDVKSPNSFVLAIHIAEWVKTGELRKKEFTKSCAAEELLALADDLDRELAKYPRRRW